MKVTQSQLRKIIKEELQEEGIFDFLRRKKASNWWANPNAPTGKSADGTQESRPADRKEYAAKIKEVARFLDSVNTGDMFFNYFEYPDRAGEVPLAIKQFNMELTPERRNELGANALSSVWSEEVRANSGRMLAQIVFDYIMASGDVQKITDQVKTYKGAGDRARGWMTLKRDFEKNRENYRAVKNAFDSLIAGKAPKKVMDAFKLSVLVGNFRLLEAAGGDFTSFYRTLLDLSDPKRSRKIDKELGVPEIEQKFDSDQEEKGERERSARAAAIAGAERDKERKRKFSQMDRERAEDRFWAVSGDRAFRPGRQDEQMRITHSQLRRIIKEELEVVLEALDFDTKTGEPKTKEGEKKCAKNKECFENFILPLRLNMKTGKRNKFSLRTGLPFEELETIAREAGIEIPVDIADADALRDKTRSGRGQAQAQARKQLAQARKQLSQNMSQIHKAHVGEMDKARAALKGRLSKQIKDFAASGASDEDVARLRKMIAKQLESMARGRQQMVQTLNTVRET